jgi:hypothetical protein
LILITMSLPEEQPPFEEPSSPIGRMQLGLAALFITPSLKKNHGDGDQFVDDKPFIDKRKPSSTTVERGVLNNGEHTLIPVTARIHMVKLVGAIRNFHENIKHIQIDVEDGTGLVRVILWRKEKECMAQRQMIHKCNSNWYIHVIGEVEDYYGVHKIIAFDVWPVSSGNKVTHHFLEVAYSFEKTLEYEEDEMLRAVLLEKIICKSLN